MAQTKTIEGMRYEVAGKVKPASNKAVNLQAAEKVGTPSILWMLVKRHKVGLLLASNGILLLSWAVPTWPTMIRALFG